MRITHSRLRRIIREELGRAPRLRDLLLESEIASAGSGARFGEWNSQHPPAGAGGQQTHSSAAELVLAAVVDMFRDNVIAKINESASYAMSVWGGEPIRADVSDEYRVTFTFNQAQPAEMGENDPIDPGVNVSVDLAPNNEGTVRSDLTAYLQDQLAAGYSPSDMSALDEGDQSIYKMALHHLTPRASKWYKDIPLVCNEAQLEAGCVSLAFYSEEETQERPAPPE
jgi:hypothetical protein